jgi:putative ABC transport system permease protein
MLETPLQHSAQQSLPSARKLDLAQLRENLQEAFVVLLENRLRSALTLLGIVIAISSIILSAGFGAGSQREILKIINANGAYQLTILPNYDTSQAFGDEGQGRLTLRDMAILQRALPDVQAMAPRLSVPTSAVRGQNFDSFDLTGSTQDIHRAANHQAQAGRLLSEQDVRAARRVVVLGAATAEKLFGAQNPIGQNIIVGNIPLRVIGVLTKRGGSTLSSSLDRAAYAPIELVRQRFIGNVGRSPDSIHTLSIILRPDQDLNAMRQAVKEILRKHYKLNATQTDPFTVISSEELAQNAVNATRVQQQTLIGVALISLIVGGIGIMNTILVSVTERIREIGVRKALGATKQVIYIQFLCESALLCMVGGVIGIVLALAALFVIGSTIGLDMSVGLGVVALALALAVGVGILAGLYPAQRAANLDPLMALRYE